MLLFLLRHAIAEDQGPDHSDASRPLSEKGRRRFAESVPGLVAMVKHALSDSDDVDAARLASHLEVFASPKVRAWQTAEMFAQGADLHVEPLAELAMDSIHPTLEWLKTSTTRAAMLVGHQPHLGLLADYLINHRQREQPLEIKKGACLLLYLPDRVDEGMKSAGATLLWLLPPATLRRIRPA